jgi:hypothetical protein
MRRREFNTLLGGGGWLAAGGDENVNKVLWLRHVGVSPTSYGAILICSLDDRTSLDLWSRRVDATLRGPAAAQSHSGCAMSWWS